MSGTLSPVTSVVGLHNFDDTTKEMLTTAFQNAQYLMSSFETVKQSLTDSERVVGKMIDDKFIAYKAQINEAINLQQSFIEEISFNFKDFQDQFKKKFEEQILQVDQLLQNLGLSGANIGFNDYGML